MTSESPFALPIEACCGHCGYSLHVLMTTTYPECGRNFDPADTTTFTTNTAVAIKRKRKRRNGWFVVLYLLVLVFIISAPGTISPLAVWNSVPVLVAMYLHLYDRKDRHRLSPGEIAFCVVATTLPVLFHLAWKLDWGGIATGSSTARLAFMFKPIWTLVLAYLISKLAATAAWLVHRSRNPEA